jgi:hypothetical protein
MGGGADELDSKGRADDNGWDIFMSATVLANANLAIGLIKTSVLVKLVRKTEAVQSITLTT